MRRGHAIPETMRAQRPGHPLQERWWSMAPLINFQPVVLLVRGPEADAQIGPGFLAPPALILQLAPPIDSLARRAARLAIQKLEDVAVHVV